MGTHTLHPDALADARAFGSALPEVADEARASDCILWPKATDSKGYGIVAHEGNKRFAHRVAYCRSKGLALAAIDGQVVRHTCDNPPCVNPEHLVLGTQGDNNRDMLERGRHAFGERNGQAVFTDEQVIALRRRFAAGGITQVQAATELGVSEAAIWSAIRGTRWKHLDVQCPPIPGRYYRIPEEIGEAVRAGFLEGKAAGDLAELHGIGKAAVWKFVQGLPRPGRKHV